jgi:hypothetical protein
LIRIKSKRCAADQRNVAKLLQLRSAQHKAAYMSDLGEPEDPSWLTDLDWLEVNKLRRAYEDGGEKALNKALRDLFEKDMPQFVRISFAYGAEDLEGRIKDAIEDAGYTFQEFIELAKKKQH